MPSRDVEIDLIGNDRTGRATRSAGNNLDQLANKVEKFEAATADSVGTVDKQGAAFTNLSNRVKAASSVVEVAARKVAVAERRVADATGSVRVAEANLNAVRQKRNVTTLQTIRAEENLARTMRRLVSAQEAAADASRDLDIKVNVSKIDVDQSRFSNLGRRAGLAFSSGVANVIADGSQAIRKGIIKLAQRAPIAVGGILALLAARLAGLLGQAITAAFGLAMGPALLAAPFAFLLKKQLEASKEVTTSEKKIAQLRKQLNNSTNKDTQERIRKQIAAERRIVAEQSKQAESWLRLKARAKSFIEFISAPLKIPFADALNEVGEGLERLKGPMREIVASLGPALAPFTKGVMELFVQFIKALEPALPGIVAGMQAWAKEMPKIGAALGDMIAKILEDPEAVTTAIENMSQLLQDLAAITGVVVPALTSLGNGFFFLERNMRALATGAGAELTGFFRTIATVVYTSVIATLSALDALFAGLAGIPFVGSLFKGASAQIHSALLGVQTDFNNTKNGWILADEEFKRRQIKARLTAESADLDSKIAAAKAKLDTVKNKKTRAKIEADIARFTLQKAVVDSQLATLNKKITKPKIQARIDELQAKVKTAKSSLDGVKNKKTIAKVKGDISAAEAEIRRLRGLLRGIPDEQVNVRVNPIINFSAASLRRMVLKNTSGESWGAALNGGGTARTGGPTVNVGAPIVDTRVFLDSNEIAAVVRSVVVDENRRNAARARVGRRT